MHDEESLEVVPTYGVWGAEDNIDCTLCVSRPMDVVFLPCRHICACFVCAPKCNTCPLCRSDITKNMRFIPGAV